MPMKNSNDTVGDRTHDVPACSVVPEPNAPLRTPPPVIYVHWIFKKGTSAARFVHFLNDNLRMINYEMEDVLFGPLIDLL